MSVCLFASLEIMSSGGDQQSQALTKPSFSEVQASALVESVFGLKVSKIQPLPSYDDQNFHVCIARTKVTTDGPNEYVLKISNTESSKTPDLIEVQTHIIMFLRAAGFPTASVCRTKGDNITSLVSVGKRPPPVIARPCTLLHFGYSRNIRNRYVIPRVKMVIFLSSWEKLPSPKWKLGLWLGLGSGLTLICLQRI